MLVRRAADGEDGGRDERDVLVVPQVRGLEEVDVGHAVSHARLLEPGRGEQVMIRGGCYVLRMINADAKVVFHGSPGGVSCTVREAFRLAWVGVLENVILCIFHIKNKHLGLLGKILIIMPFREKYFLNFSIE